MTPQRTLQHIRDITTLLISRGLVDHQHYTSDVTLGGIRHIGIAGSPDLSISMRDISYEEIYISLFGAGAYHLRMIDGALIQLLYSFDRRGLLSHRLCFFPSPSLQTYDEAAQLYEDDELFADIFAINAVRAPLRFDFSAADNEFVEVDHPRSHLTIGQYEGCRIPVTGPVTPLRFMRFILRNFYNAAYATVNLDARATQTSFPDSITELEKSLLYIAA
jgi:hypothetical protein